MQKSQKITILIRVLLIVLTVGWLWFIFSHSMQNAVESTEQSDEAAVYLSHFLFWIPEEALLSATFWIRKCAHLIEYFILGMLLAFNAVSYGKLQKQFSLVLLIGVLCAMADEQIQRYVPGRSSEVRDVWIDFCGVLLGALFICFAVWCYQKYQSRKKQERKEHVTYSTDKILH